MRWCMITNFGFGEVALDANLNSKKLRLEDLFSYQGENYVPEEYRHEIFDDLAAHFKSKMRYANSQASIHRPQPR